MNTQFRRTAIQRRRRPAPQRKLNGMVILLSVLSLAFSLSIIVFVLNYYYSSTNTATTTTTETVRAWSVVVSEGEQYGPGPTLPDQYVKYTKPAEHVFFHPLIAYPEMAFDFDYQAKGFDDYFVTVREFKKIIESMYERGYMMVDINDVYQKTTDENGKITYKQKPLYIPKGKKPFILSIDDMNYYPYMIENGTINKLVLDNNGDVAAYTVPPGGEPEVVRDLAIVPIIDDFVKEHPDFSLNNAKGLIALTGYQGVLGYRTYVKNNPARESEIELVKPVIKRLKETGWTFASHSYGHYDAAVVSYDKLKRDTQMWKDEVEPLVGPTKIYIYPFGSGVKTSDPKFKMLSDFGFDMMCTIDNNRAYYNYTDLGVVSSRWHLDGIALRYQADLTSQFYDASEIIDPVRPAEYQKR